MRMGRMQYGAYCRVRPGLLTASSGGRFADVRLIKRLVLFPGEGFASLGHLIFSRQLVLSSNWSEGVVEETFTGR